MPARIDYEELFDALRVDPNHPEYLTRCATIDTIRQLCRSISEAADLLAERSQGSPARSAAHNARLVLERALKAPIQSDAERKRSIQKTGGS